ncbi:hypothetical protein [Geobacillus sp. PK12]|uniref:hypothetical protein n=1 Tax=Geobacillus sp. PK12 TaxID=2508525 RepID=UPI0013E95E24|nr:hypothetical protein [Geobacillus sp. PK12]
MTKGKGSQFHLLNYGFQLIGSDLHLSGHLLMIINNMRVALIFTFGIGQTPS